MPASSESRLKSGGDIGQRTDRDQRHFAGIFADDLANQFRRRFSDRLDFRFGKDRSSQSVFAVRVSGSHQTAQERRLGAGSDRNVGATGDFHHAQGIGKRQFQRNVSGDRSDGFNLQLRRAHGEQQRQEHRPRPDRCR